MLEGAAGFAGGAICYSYTLDVSKRSDLRQMVVLSALGLVVMVYTRFVHYWWSIFKCLRHFFLEGSYMVLVVGVVCGVFLMPYVACMFVPDQWNKLMKFAKIYRADGNSAKLPADGELPALIKFPANGPHTKHD